VDVNKLYLIKKQRKKGKNDLKTEEGRQYRKRNDRYEVIDKNKVSKIKENRKKLR